MSNNSSAYWRRHTPGPWHYVYGAAWTTPDGPDDGGQCVAQRASASVILPVERDANMRLCAAAPDLLDALRATLFCLKTFRNVQKSRQEWTSVNDSAVSEAGAAIRKAIGAHE